MADLPVRAHLIDADSDRTARYATRTERLDHICREPLLAGGELTVRRCRWTHGHRSGSRQRRHRVRATRSGVIGGAVIPAAPHCRGPVCAGPHPAEILQPRVVPERLEFEGRRSSAVHSRRLANRARAFSKRSSATRSGRTTRAQRSGPEIEPAAVGRSLRAVAVAAGIRGIRHTSCRGTFEARAAVPAAQSLGSHPMRGHATASTRFGDTIPDGTRAG